MGKKRRPLSEDEWRACGETATLLRFVRRRASDRKRRLFSVACCRRVWHLLIDERSRDAVQVAERFADGVATGRELDAAEATAQEAYEAATAGEVAGASEAADAAYATVCRDIGWDFADYAARRAMSAARASAGKAASAEENAAQVAMLRDVFGNPFRPVSLDSAWQTTAVVALARAVYDDGRFEDMPVLADALEEAGVDAAMVAHCREPGGVHVRGCWVVDCLLERS